MAQTPTITLDPSPPTQGGSLTICYDGKKGTVLELDWDPSGIPATVAIGDDGKATVTVPANATSLVVIDPTPNGALAASTTVTASP